MGGGAVRWMSGESGRQEDNSYLQSFWRTTAVTCKLS